MSQPLGYRDPYTYKALPLLPSMALTTHVLNIERLVEGHRNQDLHQYVHLLMEGKDPRKEMKL